LFWSLIKSLQTGLLLLTGLAGYMSARCPVTTWQALLGLTGSLFLAVSGSTVLNMWYDRDIDAKMGRTAKGALGHIFNIAVEG
jgi:protoheme IX farnesyltransferase